MKNIDLGVRISKEEEEQILFKAKKLGMSKSQFVRFILLNVKIEDPKLSL